MQPARWHTSARSHLYGCNCINNHRLVSASHCLTDCSSNFQFVNTRLGPRAALPSDSISYNNPEKTSTTTKTFTSVAVRMTIVEALPVLQRRRQLYLVAAEGVQVACRVHQRCNNRTEVRLTSRACSAPEQSTVKDAAAVIVMTTLCTDVRDLYQSHNSRQSAKLLKMPCNTPLVMYWLAATAQMQTKLLTPQPRFLGHTLSQVNTTREHTPSLEAGQAQGRNLTTASGAAA